MTRPDIEAIEGRWGHEQTVLNGDFVLEKANRDISTLIAYVRELEAENERLRGAQTELSRSVVQ